MTRCVLSLGIAVFFVLPAGLAYGVDLAGLQPPPPYGVYSTMTADSPPKGKFATSLSFEKEIAGRFYRLSSNSAFGITDTIELSITLADQEEGLEDIGIGLKHRVYDETRYSPSVAYLLTASIATGDDRLSTDGRVGGGIILSKRVGPVNGHLNVIYSFAGDSQLYDELRFSAGAVFAASHNLWLLGEMFGRSSHFANDVDELEARLGYRALIAGEFYLNLGLGIDLEQSDTKYRLMASVSMVLPREKKTIKKIYKE